MAPKVGFEIRRHVPDVSRPEVVSRSFGFPRRSTVGVYTVNGPGDVSGGAPSGLGDRSLLGTGVA